MRSLLSRPRPAQPSLLSRRGPVVVVVRASAATAAPPAPALGRASPAGSRLDSLEIMGDEPAEFPVNRVDIGVRLQGRIPRPSLLVADKATSTMLKNEVAVHLQAPQPKSSTFRFATEPKQIRMADGHNVVINRCLYFESPAVYAHDRLHGCSADDDNCPAFTAIED